MTASQTLLCSIALVLLGIALLILNDYGECEKFGKLNGVEIKYHSTQCFVEYRDTWFTLDKAQNFMARKL